VTAQRASRAKAYGQFFTPAEVAATLVRWAIRDRDDRILDPACGDGAFLALHERTVGVEHDPRHAATARLRAPSATVVEADFFAWAGETNERFDAVVGNPPFIRYHGFTGPMRAQALAQARRFGADLPQLTSSWAPFVAASALLLQRGGRLAFVVPAEIGHAGYAAPLVEALARRFERVVVTAVREKLFPHLSEDAWLLFASGFDGATDAIEFAALDTFVPMAGPPNPSSRITIPAYREAGNRLRPWLLPESVLSAYRARAEGARSVRLGSVAKIGIGYVSGANAFFHLRPSAARSLRIPSRFLRPTVRRGGMLPEPAVTPAHVDRWLRDDEPNFLLHIEPDQRLPAALREYLSSGAADDVRTAYKCRARDPWYCVPHVAVPDGFFTSMSGGAVKLTRNDASCVATNSLHVVTMKRGGNFDWLRRSFASPLTRLSCELEGHPLGGGMLKIEPGEAQRLLIELPETPPGLDRDLLERGIATLRRWRHCASSDGLTETTGE